MYFNNRKNSIIGSKLRKYNTIEKAEPKECNNCERLKMKLNKMEDDYRAIIKKLTELKSTYFREIGKFDLTEKEKTVYFIILFIFYIFIEYSKRTKHINK